MCNDSEYCKKAIKEIILRNKHLEIGPDGHTLLHYAALHGDKESAQILLDKQVPIRFT
jgi:ankyrin repeat protein